jgi:hypothetical protein
MGKDFKVEPWVMRRKTGVAPSSTNRSVQKRKLSGIAGNTEFTG